MKTANEVTHYLMNDRLLEQVARWDRARALVLKQWEKVAFGFGFEVEDLYTVDGCVKGFRDVNEDVYGFEELPQMPGEAALGALLGVSSAKLIHTKAGTLIASDGPLSGAVDVPEGELASTFHIYACAGECVCGLMRGKGETECGRCGNKF